MRKNGRFAGVTKGALLFMLVISLCMTGFTPVFAAGEEAAPAVPAEEQMSAAPAEEQMSAAPAEETPINIENAAVNGVEDTYVYDGSDKTPSYEVVYTKEDGTKVTLAEGTDFSAAVKDSNGQAATPVEAGSYQLVITGQGDYTGSKTVPFKIIKKGWVKTGGQWQYYDESGNAVADKWVKTGSEWYYLKPDSYMAVNEWAKDSKGWLWMDGDGRITKGGWITVDGEWYFLKDNGYMAAGEWAKDSKGWMWLNKSGKITKDKWIQSGGQWYYLKPNGYMAANEWAKDGKGWMYMNGSGRITKSKWVKTGGQWYYLKGNGYMAAKEWTKDSKGWMYMDANGKIMKSRWLQDKGEWYYLKSNGYMAASEWAKDSSGWMFMNASGRATKDKWLKNNGNWYYLQSNGYMRTLPYVFISINEQKLYYYENGVCKLKTSVVTGKIYGVKYHGTPTGDYKIIAKQRNTHLKGLEDDGVTKYDSFVRYWMPFRGDGYGMHDADWRGSFGGTIYQYSGSHGCVNMPVSAAGKLYNMVSVGTKVHIQK